MSASIQTTLSRLTYINAVLEQVSRNLIDFVLLQSAAVEPLSEVFESHSIEATHLVALGHGGNVAVVQSWVVGIAFVWEERIRRAIINQPASPTHVPQPAHPPPLTRPRHSVPS